MAGVLRQAANPVFCRQASKHFTSRRPHVRTMAVLVDYRGKPQYDIYVKGSPEVPELGDCPFSHRTMLTFEEKGIRYNKVLLDEMKLPEWIKDVCEGQKQIPFITELDTGKWLYDSDKIIPYLEDKFPEPKLGKPDELNPPDNNLFPSFIEFAKSDGTGSQEESALLRELKKVSGALEKSEGKFFGGSSVNSVDLQIAPKLKHIFIGAKALFGWELPKELSNLNDYLDSMAERESWKQTFYTEKYVADGWKLKREKLLGNA